MPLTNTTVTATGQTALSLDVTDLRVGGVITVSLMAWVWTTTSDEGISSTISTNLGNIAMPYGNRTPDQNKMLSYSFSFLKTSGMTVVNIGIKTMVSSQNVNRIASIIAM